MLTPGQQKIREITPEFYDDYQKLKDVKPEDDLQWHEVSKRLFERFQKESLIVLDIVTGQCLHRSTPKRYINSRWQLAQANKVKCLAFEKFDGEIKFDRFAYINSNDERPAYLGGCKPGTTAKALLAIAFEDQTFELKLDSSVTYYSKAGIISPTSGSNHRLLACVLWGKLAIEKHNLTIYLEEVEDDLILFNAASVMDSLQYKKGRWMSSFPEIEIIQKHCDFLLSLKEEEMIQIRQHLKARVDDNFEYVVSVIKEYRQICQEKFSILRWWKTINASRGVRFYMDSIADKTSSSF